MPIPEQQLETWSHQGPSQQFTATYATLRAVLEDRRAPYSTRSFSIFLQGSYANDTNIYADSDVDIVVCLSSVYYFDTERLPNDDKQRFERDKSPATYSWAAFKDEVVAWLRQAYGEDVHVGSKAISIRGRGNRRDADVLVCAEWRNYRSYTEHNRSDFAEGIVFWDATQTRIVNYPKLHSDNCSAKHASSRHWFKRTVRTFKNLRNHLVERGDLALGVAPSYYIEGLLYNVPDGKYGGSYQLNFQDVLTWLTTTDRSQFVCANEQYYLLRDGFPVCWPPANCTTFLGAVTRRWNNW